MPSLISRGAMSGKGFGLTGQASGGGGTLTSVTFTANGNWVAPSSTTNVVTASGKGAPGVSDYVGTVYSASYLANRNLVSSPSAPYAQWSTLYGNYNSLLSALSSLTYPHYAPTSLLPYYSATNVAGNDTWENTTYNFVGAAYYLTGYATSTIGSPSTSGNITYSSLTSTSGWTIDAYGYISGGAGASSTALGQTFPGGGYSGSYPNGTGSAASTTTYTNIAVTPGASYPIVVPSGGSVTLEYYV
jgi:hypothetical protein